MFTGAKYARNGDVNIAYQVVGDGPLDLILVLGWVSHLAYIWELPALATFTQMSASPGDAVELLRMNTLIDIRDALPAIRVPTLIIHATGDKIAPIEAGRYFAEHIPNAKLVELDSIDHWPYFGDAELVLGEVQEFLTGVRTAPPPDTMLATVLCTNVAQAGAHAVWLGDKRWHQLV